MESEKLEIERRFLIELPLKWYGKFKVLTSPHKRIYQTYLEEPGIENSRVRMTMYSRDNFSHPSYEYNKKRFISKGINKEYEIDLTQSEYRDKLAVQDSRRNRITKTRYDIDFNKKKFELDIFQDVLLGLSILEIELYSMQTRFILPPYLKVIREITGEDYFSNRNLATLEFYHPAP